MGICMGKIIIYFLWQAEYFILHMYVKVLHMNLLSKSDST